MQQVGRDNWSDTIASAETIIVDVWGPECRPCIELMPHFEHLADEYSSSVLAVKLDASQNRRLCIDLKVFGLPTYLRFENGQEVARISGNAATPKTIAGLFDQEQGGKKTNA
jgi:thioredoxin 1